MDVLSFVNVCIVVYPCKGRAHHWIGSLFVKVISAHACAPELKVVCAELLAELCDALYITCCGIHINIVALAVYVVVTVLGRNNSSVVNNGVGLAHFSDGVASRALLVAVPVHLCEGSVLHLDGDNVRADSVLAVPVLIVLAAVINKNISGIRYFLDHEIICELIIGKRTAVPVSLYGLACTVNVKGEPVALYIVGILCDSQCRK